MKKSTKNYVNNAEFLEALKEYRAKCLENTEAGLELPRVTDYIGKCIYDIANRLATRDNFSGYSYRDEMVADGLENALKAIKSFDPEKSQNPFAYFTKVIWYAFLRRIDAEKKQQYIKHKVVENSMLTGTIIEKENGVAGEAQYVDLNNDYVNDFVETYEEKLEKKKAKNAKTVKKGLEKFIKDDE